MRRLSKKDKNFYRTCDYCDNKMGNRQTEEAFKGILEAKDNIIKIYKQKIEELADKIGDRNRRMENLTRKASDVLVS